MHGCNGRIGQTISSLLAEDAGMKIVAGIDKIDFGKNAYPVYENIVECDLEADVIIDFSNANAVDGEGYDYFGEDRTVDWQIKLLRNKLGKYREMIHTIRGVGYKFDE